MFMRRNVLIAALVVGMGLTGCGKQQQVSQTAQEQVVPVQVAKAAEGTVDEVAALTGKLTPNELVEVSPKVNGKISSIPVKLGQMVKKGDLLFTLDQTDLANSVKQAESAYQLALANLKQSENSTAQGIDQAENSVIQYQNAMMQAQNTIAQQEQAVQDATREEQRIRQLYEAGAVPVAEWERAQTALKNATLALNNARTSLTNAKASYENALKNLQHARNKTAVQVSKASVEQARVALENARDQLANATVKAPISGMIAAVHGATGQMTGPQTAVVAIANIDTIKVKVHLSEKEITNVQTGSKVTVEIPAIQQKLQAQISAISPVMDAELKAYPVEVSLANPRHELKADMVVNVRLASNQGQGKIIVIPRSALIEEQGKTFVYKIEGETAKKTEISIGKENSEKVEVKTGLKAGDQVVVKGQTLLKDGVKVRIQESK